MILCSETWEPIGKRFFNCRSILRTSSWSASDVKPSAPEVRSAVPETHSTTHTLHDYGPEREPERAASRVETWNSRSASSTWLSRAKGERAILAWDSEMRTMASSCL